jgi:hypothetical protein
MEKEINKDDLRQFGTRLIGEIRQLLIQQSESGQPSEMQIDWIKSGKVRKLLDMSPGTLQNLRISGKVRYKKIQGTYCYNRVDIQNLFKDK